MPKCPLGWQNTLNCPLGWLKHDKVPSWEPKRALKCLLFAPALQKVCACHWWQHIESASQHVMSWVKQTTSVISFSGLIHRIVLKIQWLFSHVCKNKSSGPDGISAFLLQTFAAELTPAWCPVFLMSEDSHLVPALWKKFYHYSHSKETLSHRKQWLQTGGFNFCCH